MKKTIIVAVAILLSILAVSTSFTSPKTQPVTSEYCEGWEDGYCEGWKDEKGKYALCPITPLCPLPELAKDKYRDGYNRGFKKGISDARKNYKQ